MNFELYVLSLCDLFIGVLLYLVTKEELNF